MSRHLPSEQLSMYLDEEVGPEEERRIERHLEGCGECRERLEGLRRVVGSLRGLRPVVPPEGLGLELQRQLARATPPFGDRSPVGRLGPGRMLQPAVLGSLGIVLALTVIMLLFLQALEGRRNGSPLLDGAPASETGEEASVIVGGRTFRRAGDGWVESSITSEQAAAARVLSREELERAALSPELERALEVLDGDLTLRLDGEIVLFREQLSSPQTDGSR